MGRNSKKCSEETLISILEDYTNNVVFKKVKYTDLAEYAKEKGYGSVERRDFSRNEKIKNLVKDINEKNLLSEKALNLDNKPFKSFYIDIDFIQKLSKNGMLQYLNYFNKAQSDIICENEKLKAQIKEMKEFSDSLKKDKVKLKEDIKEIKAENRELKKILIRENSKRDILYELELFEKLQNTMRVNGFKEETYVDFYNKYWNKKQSDILDIKEIAKENNSISDNECYLEQYEVNDNVVEFPQNSICEDDLGLPDFDDL